MYVRAVSEIDNVTIPEDKLLKKTSVPSGGFTPQQAYASHLDIRDDDLPF